MWVNMFWSQWDTICEIIHILYVWVCVLFNISIQMRNIRIAMIPAKVLTICCSTDRHQIDINIDMYGDLWADDFQS